MSKVYSLDHLLCDKCGAKAFHSSLGSEFGWKSSDRYNLDFCKDCLAKRTFRELIYEHMSERHL